MSSVAIESSKLYSFLSADSYPLYHLGLFALLVMHSVVIRGAFVEQVKL